ncbi:hypothetical protein AHF37_09706 [Paragonimus kellicotti]|nr:hypothetical protein AHF37_09706 [Paragonimus kellicotti]
MWGYLLGLVSVAGVVFFSSCLFLRDGLRMFWLFLELRTLSLVPSFFLRLGGGVLDALFSYLIVSGVSSSLMIEQYGVADIKLVSHNEIAGNCAIRLVNRMFAPPSRAAVRSSEAKRTHTSTPGVPSTRGESVCIKPSSASSSVFLFSWLSICRHVVSADPTHTLSPTLSIAIAIPL